jgi:hypothetical protein
MHIFKKTSKHLNKNSLDVILDFISQEKPEIEENNFEDMEVNEEENSEIGDMKDS